MIDTVYRFSTANKTNGNTLSIGGIGLQDAMFYVAVAHVGLAVNLTGIQFVPASGTPTDLTGIINQSQGSAQIDHYQGLVYGTGTGSIVATFSGAVDAKAMAVIMIPLPVDWNGTDWCGVSLHGGPVLPIGFKDNSAATGSGTTIDTADMTVGAIYFPLICGFAAINGPTGDTAGTWSGNDVTELDSDRIGTTGGTDTSNVTLSWKIGSYSSSSDFSDSVSLSGITSRDWMVYNCAIARNDVREFVAGMLALEETAQDDFTVAGMWMIVEYEQPAIARGWAYLL